MKLVGVSCSETPFVPFDLERVRTVYQREIAREISRGMKPGETGAFFTVAGATAIETIALINRVTRKNLTDRDFFMMGVNRDGRTFLMKGENLSSIKPMGFLNGCLSFGDRGTRAETLLDILVNMTKSEPAEVIRDFVHGRTSEGMNSLSFVLARKKAALPVPTGKTAALAPILGSRYRGDGLPWIHLPERREIGVALERADLTLEHAALERAAIS